MYYKLLLLIAVTLFGCSSGNKPATTSHTLTILHVADTHSRLQPVKLFLKPDSTTVELEAGGLARLAAAVQYFTQKSAKPVVFTHGGDLFMEGTAYTARHDSLLANIFEKMGLDYVIPGNHDAIARFTAFNAVNQSDLALEQDGKVIGFNQTSKQYQNNLLAVKPNPSWQQFGFEFGGTDFAKQSQTEPTVLVTHIGINEDSLLAKGLPAASKVVAIMGGHSHTLAGDFTGLGLHNQAEFPLKVQTAGGKTVVVAHTWEYNKTLGVIELTVDDNGNVLQCNGKAYLLVQDLTAKIAESEGPKKAAYQSILSNPNVLCINPNPSIQQQINTFLQNQQLDDTHTLGLSSNYLHRRLPGAIHPNGQKLVYGSQPAHLATLAYYNYLQNNYSTQAKSNNQPPVVAVVNAGSLRQDLYAGTYSYAEFSKLMPFDDTLVTISMTWAQLQKAIAANNKYALSKSDGHYLYACDSLSQSWQTSWLQGHLQTPQMPSLLSKMLATNPNGLCTVVTSTYVAGHYLVFKKMAAVDTGKNCLNALWDYMLNGNY